MRPLTEAQANACEHAKGKTCHCRCGGRLHGMSHAGLLAYEKATGLAYDEFLYQLPLWPDETIDEVQE